MKHLHWHKTQLAGLGSKIEGLLDNHPPKPECLSELSQSFVSVGNKVEYRRLLAHALKLWRKRGDVFNLKVAQALGFLSDANRLLALCKEGIPQAREASGIYEQLNSTSGQAHSLRHTCTVVVEREATRRRGRGCIPSTRPLPRQKRSISGLSMSLLPQ